jgi:LysM repeat protein
MRSALADGDLKVRLVVAGLALLLLAMVLVTVISLSSGPATESARAAKRTLPPYWRVHAGQTYETIADKTGLSVDQLETFNPYIDPYSLHPGQRVKLRLHVPPPPPKRKGPRTWTVRRGQSFASIAAKTGHSVLALRALNPRLKPAALQPGQRMRLRP